MKKTLLSVATVTALTGIASANISANEYVPEDVQDNHDVTYNYEENGNNYSYYWYYGDVDGGQYADQYSSDSGETAATQSTNTAQAAPAVNEAPADEEVQAPAVQESEGSEEVQAPAVVESSETNGNAASVAHSVASGKSYVHGANSATAVDCSALTQQFMKEYKGIDIPRTVSGQQAAGTQVSDPQAGDLVVFNGGSHVGIYIGDGQMVDALNPSEHVGERSVSYVNGSVDGYYRF